MLAATNESVCLEWTWFVRVTDDVVSDDSNSCSCCLIGGLSLRLVDLYFRPTTLRVSLS